MKITTVEPWVEEPLQRFVNEARVRIALLLHPSGQVVAQCGFSRSVEVAAACALAAAIHASAGELGRTLDGAPFREMHHAGRERQVFIAVAPTPRTAYVFLTVFDGESSLGLVRMFFERLQHELASASAAAPAPAGPVLTGDFEGDLNRSLATLFGGEGPRPRLAPM